MMKLRLWPLLLLLFSLSAQSTECLDLFKKFVDRQSLVNYQLNYDRTIKRIKDFAESHPRSVKMKTAFKYDGEDIYRLDLASHRQPPLGRIIISAGVHGNESVTTATAVDLLDELVIDDELRAMYDFVIYPNMNPGGLKKNSRYLNNGADYNRTFKPGKDEKITRLFKESLKGEEFDLGLDLHEAYKKPGFFIIKAQDTDTNYISKILSELDEGLMFTSPTGAYPYNVPMTKNPNKTAYILESPGITTSLNGGTVKAFYRDKLGAKASYTLESSGQIELGLRKNFYQQMVMSFIRNFQFFP